MFVCGVFLIFLSHYGGEGSFLLPYELEILLLDRICLPLCSIILSEEYTQQAIWIVLLSFNAILCMLPVLNAQFKHSFCKMAKGLVMTLSIFFSVSFVYCYLQLVLALLYYLQFRVKFYSCCFHLHAVVHVIHKDLCFLRHLYLHLVLRQLIVWQFS